MKKILLLLTVLSVSAGAALAQQTIVTYTPVGV